MKTRVVLLSGGHRKPFLEEKIGLAILSLPVRSSTRLIDAWVAVLSEEMDGEPLINLVVSSSSGLRSLNAISDDERFELMLDPRLHRGTAGVLADLREKIRGGGEESEYLLVIDRGSCPPRSLESFAEAISAGPDILIGVSELDRLTGMMAIKTRILDLVPDVGYFDLKEQLLNRALKEGFVIETHSVMPRAIRLDSLGGYLEAVKYLAADVQYDESSSPARFEGECCVAPNVVLGRASIKESILMEGAVVADGAVIARSVVCPGVTVPAGSRIIDSIVDKGWGEAHSPRAL